jgi:small conductance mechanosensitive channel
MLILIFMTASLQAETAKDDEASDIQVLVERLNTDIIGLDLLTEKIKSAEQIDRDVLVFRQDERSFRLLNDFESLVNEVARLSDDSPHKEKLAAQLIELSDGVGDAIFNRITEIKLRIDSSYAELDSLSGDARVVSLAYLQTLESFRIRYYQALVSHIEGRKALGLSSKQLRERIDPKIYMYAETLAGRIELSSASRTQIQNRAQQIPDNADINAAFLTVSAQHAENLRRLETMIPVLDSLDLSSSRYKAILLQHSPASLSVSLYSTKALLSVLKDGWVKLQASFKKSAPDLMLRLLIFVAVLLLFRIFSRLTRRVVRAASDRSSLDMSSLLKNMMVSLSGGTVMAIGILIALSTIGISLTPMLAGLGVAGFIIGFALQDSLSNFAAGAMILIYRPYDVDDLVEVTGASGQVKQMNLVSTTIATLDNQILVVPNSKIWGDVIKNVTAQRVRRVDLLFGIGYEDDIELAEKVLEDIVTTNEKVLKRPAPNVRLHELADSSINFIVRPWVKTDDYWDVYWEITREVKMRFDREGISIPFPQRDVHLYKEKETQAT